MLLSSLRDENRSRKTALRTLLLALRANRRDETGFFAWPVRQVMDGRAALVELDRDRPSETAGVVSLPGFRVERGRLSEGRATGRSLRRWWQPRYWIECRDRR